MPKTILLGAIVAAVLGATALTFKLTAKPQAQSLDPAIVTNHLRQLEGDLALP